MLGSCTAFARSISQLPSVWLAILSWRRCTRPHVADRARHPGRAPHDLPRPPLQSYAVSMLFVTCIDCKHSLVSGAHLLPGSHHGHFLQQKRTDARTRTLQRGRASKILRAWS